MLDRLRLFIADRIMPAAPQRFRRFDAAGGGRRANGFGFFGRTSTEVSGAASIVRGRARALAANNPFIAQGVANWVGALIGPGIVPAGDADAVALFSRWSDNADADNRTNFSGLQEAMARALIVDGEAFMQVIATDAGVRLRLLPAEQVDESRSMELADGGHVVGGIEFDATGERVAYHVLPARPTDLFATYAAPVRVPADAILHVFKPLGIGQARGISWLAPIVIPAFELDAIVDALAVGVKVAALHAGFLIDANGAGGPFDGDTDLANVSLEPGTIRRLPAGFDIKFNSPEHAKETAAFLRFNLQMLAAGLGLPEHLLSGDLSQASYSSLRAGLLPFRARVEATQYNALVPQLLAPVWRRVIGDAVLRGEIDAIPRVDWLPPRPGQVDPLKDVEATIAEIEAGLTSRAKAVAERGWSIDDLDAEIARDRARETALGLSFPVTAKQNTDSANA